MALQSKRGAYGCGGTQGSRGGEARLAACSTTAARAPQQQPQQQQQQQQQRRVVVVGLGVGGLVMAGRLARAGYDVTAVERGADAGGRIQSESSESSVRFDTGPSLLLFPHKYREAFASLGASLDDRVELHRVEPAYRVHFSRGSSIDLLYDTQAMISQLERFECGAGSKFVQWLSKARITLDKGLKAFIEQDVSSILDFVDPRRILEMALKVGPPELLQSQYSQMRKYFTDERLRALFSYQELYVGLSPYTAPGVFSLLAATELTDGVWYPIGGFQQVRNALRDIARENGAKLRFNEEVDEIETTSQSSAASNERSSVTNTVSAASGVRLASGELLDADIVVANADLPHVYANMLPHRHDLEQESKRVNERMEYSCGVISFNWSVSSKQTNLLHHNVFLSENFKEGWEPPWHPSHFRQRRAAHFYVHKPTHTDSTAAPEGCESVMVLLPVANLRDAREKADAASVPEPSRQELIDAGRECVLQQMEGSGLNEIRESIYEEFVIDRENWAARYNLTHGAAFGLSHGIFQLACFRPPVQSGIPALDSPTIDGLYFVGASTRPGNGVPLVMMGCETTYQRIIARYGEGMVSA
jgi:phytoene desaturase (3,4-didehydrolycopene-forming)